MIMYGVLQLFKVSAGYKDDIMMNFTMRRETKLYAALVLIVWDLTPYYVPTSIRELSMFFIQQSDRWSVAEPGGLRLAAKAAGVI